jgi:hypothetical protein
MEVKHLAILGVKLNFQLTIVLVMLVFEPLILYLNYLSRVLLKLIVL